MILDLLLWPLLRRYVEKTKGIPWFCKRVQEQIEPLRTVHPFIKGMFAFVVMTFIVFELVHVKWGFRTVLDGHIPESIAAVVFFWMYSFALCCVALSILEVLDCVSVLHLRRQEVQRAVQIVCSNMTAHERMEYEEHARRSTRP